MATFGSLILAEQLKKFGIKQHPNFFEKCAKNELLALMLEMYGYNGDLIAKQYAGSEAFHKATLCEVDKGDWKTKKQSITFLAIKRYFSNVMLDTEKQKNLWLFLGDFIPKSEDKKHLWDLDLQSCQKIMV